jgi:hypothetical protein
MASQSLVGFGAPGSPQLQTSVAFLASISINGQEVSINTGDVTQGLKNLVFSLANPVVLGSIGDFLNYLHDKVGIPLTEAELEDLINKLPSGPPEFFDDFKDALLKILHAKLSITVLNINVGAGTFTLGVSFDLDLSLFGFLTINSIGVIAGRRDTTASPP